MTRKDWLILVIPILLLILAIPFLPDQVPMQFTRDGSVNWTMSRYLFPIVGVLPYVIYRAIAKKNQK